MNKKILIISTSLIIVILSVSATVMISTKKESSETKIDNWKTHIDEEYGYEIKYPEDIFKPGESLCMIPVSGEEELKDENAFTLSHEASLKSGNEIDLRIKFCNVSGNYKDLAGYYAFFEPTKIGSYDAYFTESAYNFETMNKDAFSKDYYVDMGDNKTTVIIFSGLNFSGGNISKNAISWPEKNKILSDMFSTLIIGQ